jgi:hypothetical protein
VPVLLASLAFINPVAAYTAQGAFCSLPSQPIWYRLGLSWIPRYIIGLTVIGLAIAVYVHVELRFRSFAAATKRASTTSASMPTPSHSRRGSVDRTKSVDKSKIPVENVPVMPTGTQLPSKTEQEQEAIASAINSPKEGVTSMDHFTLTGDQNRFPQRADKKQSICTTSSTVRTATSEKSVFSFSKQSPLVDPQTPAALASTALEVSPRRSPESANLRNRRIMRRQLRLIFIYPLVYIALWIPPLTLNLMQYFPKYSKSLPSSLAVTSTMCLTLMGGIDCVVFLWREKPWRRGARPTNALRRLRNSYSHSEGHEGGTLDEEEPPPAGSTQPQSQTENPNSAQFAFPQSPTQTEDMPSPLPSSLFPRLGSRTKLGQRGSTSESQNAARERAYERLALEAADRRGNSYDSRVSTEQGSERGGSIARAPSREWWDRRDSLA